MPQAVPTAQMQVYQPSRSTTTPVIPSASPQSVAARVLQFPTPPAPLRQPTPSAAERKLPDPNRMSDAEIKSWLSNFGVDAHGPRTELILTMRLFLDAGIGVTAPVPRTAAPNPEPAFAPAPGLMQPQPVRGKEPAALDLPTI